LDLLRLYLQSILESSPCQSVCQSTVILNPELDGAINEEILANCHRWRICRQAPGVAEHLRCAGKAGDARLEAHLKFARSAVHFAHLRVLHVFRAVGDFWLTENNTQRGRDGACG
jgi:hypothetical protein